METVFARDRAQWRRWLASNCARRVEIWLVFYKKSAGKPGVTYEHAVEEALCFGWIDGVKKKLDEVSYVYRFTPRKSQSQWSKSNLQRMERLVAEGKVMPAGFQVYNSDQRREVPPLPTQMPKALEEEFRENAAAWANYEKSPPGYRRMTAGWVASAKKEETRSKRLEKLIEFSARNERIQFM